MTAKRHPLLRLAHRIDRFTSASANIVVLLLAPLVLANVVEVVMRYFLGSPTTWAADMTVMTYGPFFMLGAAYTMLKGGHVRTDMLWDRFSVRTKGWIDGIAYLLLLLPVMGLIFFTTVDEAWNAYSIGERSELGLWRPLTWPFRSALPLAALLMFVQGISETIKAIWTATTGEVLIATDKIEI